MKLPEITALFWIVKVLTTGMGEATSDYAVHKIDPVTAVLLGGIPFVCAMGLQLSVDRYIAWVYWLAVVLISVVGTLLTDELTDGQQVPLWISTTVFAVLLAVVFAVWYARERTLSIHSIITPSREAFYWLTVLVTFALGTAEAAIPTRIG